MSGVFSPSGITQPVQPGRNVPLRDGISPSQPTLKARESCAAHGALLGYTSRTIHIEFLDLMAIANEHNLAHPIPDKRPFGIRVRLKSSDPFRNLVGSDWTREHWYATREERDRVMAEMSRRYIYFRPGDQPTLDYEPVDKK